MFRTERWYLRGFADGAGPAPAAASRPRRCRARSSRSAAGLLRRKRLQNARYLVAHVGIDLCSDSEAL
jgi:hypothetical protein